MSLTNNRQNFTELFELVKKLKRESSFVNAEKKHLLELYSQVIFFLHCFRLIFIHFGLDIKIG